MDCTYSLFIYTETLWPAYALRGLMVIYLVTEVLANVLFSVTFHIPMEECEHDDPDRKIILIYGFKSLLHF